MRAPPHLLIAALAVHAVAFAISAARERPAGRRLRSLLRDRQHAAAGPTSTTRSSIRSARCSCSRRWRACPAAAPSFGLGIVVLNLIADAIIVGALLWGWGIAAAAAFGAAALRPGARALLQPRRPVVDRGRHRRGGGVAAQPAARARACALADRRRLQALAARAGDAADRAVARPAIVDRRLAAFAPAAMLLGGVAVWIAGIEQRRAGADVPRRDRLADREPGRQPRPPRPIRRSLRLESGAWRSRRRSTGRRRSRCFWRRRRSASGQLARRASRSGRRRMAGERVGVAAAVGAALGAVRDLAGAGCGESRGPRATGGSRCCTAIAIVLTQCYGSRYGSVSATASLPAMLIVVARNAGRCIAASASPRLASLVDRRLPSVTRPAATRRTRSRAPPDTPRRRRRRAAVSRAECGAPARRTTGTAPR